MNPSDALLKQLNEVAAGGFPSPIPDYYAVQSSFSSTQLVNKVLLRGVKCLFKNNFNDLIVPTLGTSTIDGSPRLPRAEQERSWGLEPQTSTVSI